MVYMESNHHVYMGYYLQSPYNRTLLAVSKEKDILKTYLEYHRGLPKDKYVIESEELTDIELLSKYENKVMVNWHNYFIPNIDAIIIDIYSKSIDVEITQVVSQLQKILLISKDIKKIPISDNDNIMKAMRTLNGFLRKPKIINKMAKLDAVNNSILFCDIQEYLQTVKSFEDIKDMNSKYNMMMYKD